MKKPKEKYYLFDLDGTLTEPRQPISLNTTARLKHLMKHEQWGVISGSTAEMIKEQLGEHRFKDWMVYVCNGTKVFSGGEEEFSVSMRGYLGPDYFERLMGRLIETLYLDSVFLIGNLWTGNFIVNRGSMVNFSLIGRGENDFEAREKFVKLDERHGIRDRIVKDLRKSFRKLHVCKGGQTSIDILPKGWGKDFVRQHIPKNYDIVFFGDKLMEGGNDHDMLKVAKCYQVSGPKDCLRTLKLVMEDEK